MPVIRPFYGIIDDVFERKAAVDKDLDWNREHMGKNVLKLALAAILLAPLFTTIACAISALR
jgi:hypothetical protein